MESIPISEIKEDISEIQKRNENLDKFFNQKIKRLKDKVLLIYNAASISGKERA